MCYLSWLPIIIWFIYESKKRPILIFIPCFFITHFFFANAGFVIRQYLSCVFLFMFLYFSHKETINSRRYIFLFFSIATHLASILIITVYFFSKFVSNKKSDKTVRLLTCILLLITTLSLISGVDLSQSVISILLDNIDKINIEVLLRKALYYKSDNLSSDINIPVFILIVTQFYFLSSVLLFTKINNKKILLLLLFFYLNIFMFLILRNTTVISNRVGFLSFYFVIPSFVMLFSIFSVNISNGTIKLRINI